MPYIKNNPLQPPTSKIIKPYNCSMIATEGPNIVNKLNISGMEISYDSVATTSMILNGLAENQPLLYGFLGMELTFIMIKATYPTAEANCVSEEDNYLEYFFADDPGTIRYMGKLMILTGNSVNRIPQMYFNNPNECSVQLEIMMASLEQEDITDVNTDVSRFTNLYYNSVITDQVVLSGGTIASTQFQFLDIQGNVVLYLSLEDVDEIQPNDDTGVMTITTVADAVIVLEFISVFNMKQAHSRINWVLEAPIVTAGASVVFSERILTRTEPILDTVPPGIYMAHTGDTMPLVSGATLDLIREYWLDYILDLDGNGEVRDGYISIYDTSVQVNRNGGLEQLTGITSEGIYDILFTISDIAGNVGYEQLEEIYVDNTPPVITFLNTVSNSAFTINLPDDANQPASGITHSDIIRHTVASVFDAVDGLIPNSAVSLEITGLSGPDDGVTGITNIMQPGGVYRVVYTVSDQVGNTTTATLTMDVDGEWYIFNSGDTYTFNEYETDVFFKYFGDPGTYATIILGASGSTTGQTFLVYNSGDTNLVWDYSGSTQTIMDVGDVIYESWNGISYSISFSGLGCLEFDIATLDGPYVGHEVGFSGNTLMTNCSGSLSDGFTLITDRDSGTTYITQLTDATYTSSIPLASSMNPLYMTINSGSSLDLMLYYSGHTSDPAYYFYYGEMILGNRPFAYLDGSDGKLYDGATYWLTTGKTEIVMYGNYTLGDYTISGTLTDSHNNTGSFSYEIVVDTNSAVLGSGETYVFTGVDTGVSFEYTGESGTTGYITISGETFAVYNSGGSLVWDFGGADEHTFSTVGESISVGILGVVFTITFNGYGSLLFTLINTNVPTAPVIYSPADGSTGVTVDAVLEWYAVTGATYYTYEYDTNSLFTSSVSGTTTYIFKQLSDLNYAETYYWRVKAHNDDEVSLWMSTASFTTEVLGVPTLLAPESGSTGNSSGSTTLNWTDVTGATFYSMQYDTGVTFSGVTTYTGTTSEYYLFNMLDSGTTYYWRARAENPHTYSDWADYWSFTTE